MKLAAGDTFINRDDREHGIPAHLWIVLSEPDQGEGAVLIANLTSDDGWDTTCRLEPGEHTFVKKVSYVNYGQARMAKVDRILDGLRAGVLHFHEPFDCALLMRVRRGAADSPELKKKRLAFLKGQGLV